MGSGAQRQVAFLFRGIVPPSEFSAACVSGTAHGPNRVLHGQHKQNQGKKKSPNRAMTKTYVRRTQNRSMRSTLINSTFTAQDVDRVIVTRA